jgi:hypothetical protein
MINKKKEQYIEFLNYFLKCLGFKKYIITMIRKNKLYGKVFYDDFEYEKIRWDFNGFKQIDDNVVKIIEMLTELNLVDIDKIKITRAELYEHFMNRFGEKISYSTFCNKLNVIINIKVERMNRYNVYDWFYIHK